MSLGCAGTFGSNWWQREWTLTPVKRSDSVVSVLVVLEK